MPHWKALAERALRHEAEHPGAPLPSDLTGELAAMIARVDRFKQKVDELLGENVPEQVRATREAMDLAAAPMRALLRPLQN